AEGDGQVHPDDVAIVVEDVGVRVVVVVGPARGRGDAPRDRALEDRLHDPDVVAAVLGALARQEEGRRAAIVVVTVAAGELAVELPREVLAHARPGADAPAVVLAAPRGGPV